MWIEIRHVDSVLLASLQLELSPKPHDASLLIIFSFKALTNFYFHHKFLLSSTFCFFPVAPFSSCLHQHRFQDAQKQDQFHSDCEGSAKESYFPKSQRRSSSGGESRSRQHSSSRSRSSDSSRRKKRQPSTSDSESEGPNSGVLSQQSAQHRHNRRVDSAQAEMSGGRRSQTKKAQTPEQRELEEMRARMAALEKENKLQEAQIQAAKKSGKSGKRGKYVAKIPMNKELEKKITKLCGAQGPTLWRTTKFLNTEDDIYLASKTIMADLPECKKLLEGDPGTVEENILAFLDTYQGAITTGINEQRNNTQTGLKNAYIERYDNKEDMPHPNDLLKVILRKDLAYPIKPKEPPEADFPGKPDKYAQAKNLYEQKMQKYLAKRKEVKKNRDYFKWYWTCLLPKVCGNKRWGVTIRNFGTISGHAPVDTPKKKYVTTSNEALVQVLFENCGQRFPYLASLERRKFTNEERGAEGEFEVHKRLFQR